MAVFGPFFPGLTGFFEKWTFINVQNSFGDIKLGTDFGRLFALLFYGVVEI
jgi:hypothetical protein